LFPREKDDKQTQIERVSYLFNFPTGSCSTISIDKNCSGRPRQPAKERPATHFALRDKHGWSKRTQSDDIEVAEMIANH
jgi:hypothetical protein